jgi:hypothetical protein
VNTGLKEKRACFGRKREEIERFEVVFGTLSF